MQPEGFGGRVRAALAWRWGSQLLAQLITWGATLIVVRLLFPADYGLFAMTQVVVVALNFLNGWSFASSLIQAEKVTDRAIGQVFALLLMLNGVLAALQIGFAPVIADYYQQPRIADMLRIQALIYLTTPFIALPTALLSRRLEFRSQGLANLASAVTGAVTAFALAWRGYGVWALVWAPIVSFATRGLIMTIAARLLVWPRFDFRGASGLIGFGGALTLCQLFWIVQSQSDVFIAGRYFDPHDLGIYAEALFLTLIITGRFLPPINEVAFPAYSELHQAGLSLGPYFERTARSVLLVTAPLYIGLALTAPEAIATVFGPKWLEMAPIASGLALAMPLMALQIICSPATNAQGQVGVYLACNIAGAILFVGCFMVGVRSGPQGLVHAWWVAAPALLAVTLALTLPRIGLHPWRLLLTAAPAVTGCLGMAAAIAGLRLVMPDWSDPVKLVLMIAVGGLAYAAILLALWRGMLRDSWTMLRRR